MKLALLFITRADRMPIMVKVPIDAIVAGLANGMVCDIAKEDIKNGVNPDVVFSKLDLFIRTAVYRIVEESLENSINKPIQYRPEENKN
jgi:hypothetical protein